MEWNKTKKDSHIRMFGPWLMMLFVCVWGGMETQRNGALLEGACHWEWALRVHRLTCFLVGSLCFLYVAENVMSASCLGHHACPAIVDSPSGAISQNKLFFP